MPKIQIKILVAVLVFVALISALFAFRAGQIRDEAYTEAVAALSGQTLALKAFSEESLGNVDGQLRVIVARVRAVDHIHAPELRDMNVVFAARARIPAFLINVMVAGPDGRVLAATIPDPPPSLAERPYFIHHLNRSSSDPHFTRAIESPTLPGARRFTMSRRLETRGGKFAGIVVADLDVEALAREYDRMRLYAEYAFVLIAADGIIVTVAPYSKEFVGRTVPLQAPQENGAPAIFVRPEHFDGEPRLIVQRWLDHYPFAIGASMTENAVYARSRRELPQLAVVWSLIMFVTTASGYLLARQIRYASEARESLDRAGRELDFYRYALDQHAIVDISDTNGTIVYANDKFCEVAKYGREELLGHNHRALNSGHHPKEFFSDLWRTIAGGNVWRGEIRDRAKDGSLFWLDTAIVPLPDEQGRPFRYFAIRLDITPRKRMEADLLAAKERAEVANRVKSELIANTSHELRTPLNAVIGFSDVMKDELLGPLDPKYREYATDINNAGRHLLRIVNDILDVSAIEADKLELHEERVDLAECLKSAVHLIRSRAKAGAIELGEDIPEGLPNLYADELRLKQIVLNLLSNAIKFNGPGGSVAVSAGLAADGGLFFRVADTGIGMDEAGIAVAMTKFGQVDSGLGRKHEGTGLGLPLAQSLVEIHGGRFAVESAKGKGTVVTVAFPRERTVNGEAAGSRPYSYFATPAKANVHDTDGHPLSRA